MKVLVTGAAGQVGCALLATAPDAWNVLGLTRGQLDLAETRTIAPRIEAERPDLVINAAAYTAVDRAENDADTAMLVNSTALAEIAAACGRVEARLVHISTDYVFDGTACRPYPPTAATNPLGVYGRTKLLGERHALAFPRNLVVRTAWVYSAIGSNFVKTMLRLMRERPEVRVVADQLGTPTYARSLASGIWAMAASDLEGVHHYTDSGSASWYDFAVAIQEEAVALGILPGAVPIIPISADEYPTPAKRPSYSILDTRSTSAALGRIAPHWRKSLRTMMMELKEDA